MRYASIPTPSSLSLIKNIKSALLSPHQPSHWCQFTTKILYINKHNEHQNDTTRLISSLKYVISLNTIITHPYPKSENASFSASTILPLSVHRTTQISSDSFMFFLSTCKIKRKEGILYFTIMFEIRKDYGGIANMVEHNSNNLHVTHPTREVLATIFYGFFAFSYAPFPVFL